MQRRGLYIRIFVMLRFWSRFRKNAYIRDLGRLISIIYRIRSLPYVVPGVLQKKPFTKASDIYSFGVIMWEISSGNFVFSDYKDDDSSLAVNICFGGLKPNILKGTAPCYEISWRNVGIWTQKKRPSALEMEKYSRNFGWIFKMKQKSSFFNFHNVLLR